MPWKKVRGILSMVRTLVPVPHGVHVVEFLADIRHHFRSNAMDRRLEEPAKRIGRLALFHLAHAAPQWLSLVFASKEFVRRLPHKAV